MSWNQVIIKIGKENVEAFQNISNPNKFSFTSAVQMDGVKTFSCEDQSFEVFSVTDVANRGEEYIVETIQEKISGKSSKRGDSD
tara:strand:- start:573 stop:824 length:252 start_codon:yes stop_codon:yes gene_type:complete